MDKNIVIIIKFVKSNDRVIVSEKTQLFYYKDES